MMNEQEHVALRELREAYRRASQTVNESSSQAQRARSILISEANRLASCLSQPVFWRLLASISQRSGKSGGFTMPRDAMERASQRRSFGPPGVIPERHAALRSHIAAALRTIDDMAYTRT